jgi:hypothetical protein
MVRLLDSVPVTTSNIALDRRSHGYCYMNARCAARVILSLLLLYILESFC